jgi:hypothetical protein
MVPSVILFMNLLKLQVFENRATVFVDNVVKFEGAEIVKSTMNFDAKFIDIYLIGRPVPQTKINEWNNELKNTDKLQDISLRVYQGADQSGELAEKLSSEVKAGILEDLYVKNEQLLQDKDSRITFLENEIATLKINNVPFKELSQEVKINYQEIETFSYSNKITTNFQRTDTLPVINVRWKSGVSVKDKKEQLNRLRTWLKFKMQLDTISVTEYP